MITRTSAVIVLALLLGGCHPLSGLYGNDELDRYAQRLDSITDSAGNAKEVNRATHMNHPWPPYVMDRRIPVHGDRMARTIERYRRGPPAPAAPTVNLNIGGAAAPPAGGTGAATGGGAAGY